MGSLTAGGIAFVIAVVAGITWWKGGGPRFVPWAMLLVGLLGAGTIMGLLGGFVNFSILGVGFATILLVVCGTFFWHEVIKKRGTHYIRTPIAALGLGVALSLIGGTIGGLAQQGGAQVVNFVHSTGGSATGG
jgi:hypothetical protein